MSRPALAATRAIYILNFLAAHPGDSFSMSDIADRLAINLASAHAVLAVLTEAGYLVRHPRQRTYTLGPSVVALGSAALERHAVIDLARGAAREFADEVGLEVAVTAVAGDEIVVLARVGERQARGIAIHVGQRVPLVPPLGSVFMAWSPEEQVDVWLAGEAEPAESRAVLAGVRSQGYSIALEGDARRGLGDVLDHLADAPADSRLLSAVAERVAELGRREYQVFEVEPTGELDVSMIAAPVFGADGEVVLALTLIGFRAGLLGARIARYGERLRDLGLIVTKRSHGRLPAN